MNVADQKKCFDKAQKIYEILEELNREEKSLALDLAHTLIFPFDFGADQCWKEGTKKPPWEEE